MKASRLMSWPAYLWISHGIGPPSNGVPLSLLYQSTTSRWPSGLSIGMTITTTFCRICRASPDRSPWPARRAARWRPASRRSPTRGCCTPMATTALCVAASRSASSGESVRGSASRWLSRDLSRFRMLSGATTIAAIVRWLSVVGPRSDDLDAVRNRPRRARSTSRWRLRTRAGGRRPSGSRNALLALERACCLLLSPGSRS